MKSSIIIREMQIKTTPCPINGGEKDIGKDMEHPELSYIAAGTENWYKHFGNGFRSIYCDCTHAFPIIPNATP